MAEETMHPELARLWRVSPESRLGRPSELDVDTVVGQAVALADQDGLAAVTLPKIAKARGYTPMGPAARPRGPVRARGARRGGRIDRDRRVAFPPPPLGARPGRGVPAAPVAGTRADLRSASRAAPDRLAGRRPAEPARHRAWLGRQGRDHERARRVRSYGLPAGAGPPRARAGRRRRRRADRAGLRPGDGQAGRPGALPRRGPPLLRR